MKRLCLIVTLLLLPVVASAQGLRTLQSGLPRLVKISPVKYIDLNSGLAVSESSYNFPDTNTGSTATRTITLTATNNAPSEGITATVSGTGFTRNGGTCSTGEFDLNPGDSCTVIVQFGPTVAGAHSGAVTFVWPNRSDVVVSLTGTGVMVDQYTTDHASNWSGTGVLDTSNPAGGVYSGWTSANDTAGRLSNTDNALVITYSGTKETARLDKTGLTSHADVRMKARVTVSTVTMGNNVNAQLFGIPGFMVFEMQAQSSTLNRIVFWYYNGAGSPQTAAISYAWVASTPVIFEMRGKKSTTTGTADGNFELLANGISIWSVSSVTTAQNTTAERVGMLYSDNNITGQIIIDEVSRGHK